MTPNISPPKGVPLNLSIEQVGRNATNRRVTGPFSFLPVSVCAGKGSHIPRTPSATVEAMTKTPRAAAIIAAFLLGTSLVACTATPTSLTTAPAPTADDQPSPAEGCLTITDGARSKLGSSIAAQIPGAEIRRVGLVASDDSDMHVLAVEFTDPGLDLEFTGIWGSMQDLTIDDDPAFIAVDSVAAASADYLQPADLQGVGAQLSASESAVDCLA